ncbi:ABC transporter permease [Rapidithrix thailandica]|uniref:ABC transporter permease n=1 Tax=Rapidithrix thailandica TaxID=413964 RepID=A0AAW9S447_9BACT
MKALSQLIIREVKIFKGNSVAWAIFIGAPILYALLVGAVYQQSTVSDLPVSVVDLDNSALSHQIIDALNDNPYVEVAMVRQGETHILEDLKTNAVAVVKIPKGFEGDVHQKRHPEVQVEINGANILTANYSNLGIRSVLATLNAGIEIKGLNKKGIPVETAYQQFEAFQIGSTRFYNANSNYLTFMWPGVMGTILQQVFLLVMALTFALEFETGRFHEMTQISKNPLLLLLAKSLPYWLMGFLLWGGIQWVFFPMVRLPMVHSQVALLALTAVFMWALTNMGALVSWLLPNQLKATEVLMVIATPSFIMSGFTWPLSEMPKAIQHIAECIPLTHFLSAFRKVLFLQGTYSDIQPELFKLGITAIITGIITLILIQVKVRKTAKA